MFSDDQELYSSLMYYQVDPHAQKTHTQLHVADSNFGFPKDVFDSSMKDELDFSQDYCGLKSTKTTVTDLHNTIQENTDLDSYLKELVDPLLRQEDSFPLLDDDYTASLDLSTIQLDSLDMAGTSLEEEVLVLNQSGSEDLSSQEPPGLPRPRRSSRAAAAVAVATMAQIMQDSADLDIDHQYTTLTNLGLNIDEVPRKRQPRVSYSTLTEQQKHQHIRELNNMASRNYRDKKVKQLNQLQQLEDEERLRNQQLHRKVQGLQQLRDQMEEFKQTFMRLHVGSGSRVAHTSH